ncbi:uncharacterized protein KY384_001064 [Bacidia gigantensis]|uniref:uncharacterized protein n=1 Tax=Bacidia gigantensis TaxID=2732470 RepID=UPI001D038FC7|nr:uncharacterized protein KY384_001064 [Bacidia gigantensis]KAG8534220.1 hypothetical protein KY384_001064 [Bacidia gigantensis]
MTTNNPPDFLTIIKQLSLDSISLHPTRTRFLEHRKVCLHTIGLNLTEEKLSTEVSRLAESGQQIEAAFLALLLHNHNLALTALKTGKNLPRHRVLAIAVAGYDRGNNDGLWSEAVDDMRQNAEDPYSRAIFALVRRGNWRDVLKEPSLPLTYSTAIALLHLSDTEVTKHINDATTSAEASGDISGIFLTGLTEQSISLFETYITKHPDLQTTVLAFAHVVPRYFTSHVDVQNAGGTGKGFVLSWAVIAFVALAVEKPIFSASIEVTMSQTVV